jgi:hypothetical protein
MPYSRLSETYRPAIRPLPQELQPWKLKTPPSPLQNMTLTAQVANLSGGAAAGGAAGGGAGATTAVTFAATPAMVNHQDLIDYRT